MSLRSNHLSGGESCHPKMRYHNGPQSAATMVASYGVYNDTHIRNEEDEDGFIPRANVYRGVVVNASGDSSVVRPPTQPVQQQTPQSAESSTRCGWCLSPSSSTPPTTDRESCIMSWCRPTILLLILVLLVIVFVLVSGILLYYNCRFTNASSFDIGCYIKLLLSAS